MGSVRGNNLFQSFSQFNLNAGEVAAFSGPKGIQNILSRVTGGSPSSINGTIRSDITGANFFFINPNGIVFGPNAAIDVSGSFAASTANYLKLADGAMAMSLENLVGVMRKVSAMREARCALVIDYASRISRQPDRLDPAEHRFFVAAERISLTSHPIVPKGADIASPGGKARFNPILWLVNRAQDLPSWLALDSTRVAPLTRNCSPCSMKSPPRVSTVTEVSTWSLIPKMRNHC